MSTDTNKAETAVAYAALILADEGLEITPEKLQALLKAASIEDVEPIWTTIFAKALQGKVRKPKNHAVLETFADLNRQDVKDILTTVTASTLEAGKKQAPVNENDQDQPDQGGDEDGDGSDGEGSEDEAMFLLFD
jgi:large subunit ribosomal protein LP1